VRGAWQHRGVRQTRSALLAAVPVSLLGCVAAHWAAYAIVHPDAHERAHALAGTGHGYAGYLPLAALAAVGLAALGAARHAATRPPGARPSPWLFATLPPAAFAVQEHLERLLHAGSFPLDAALQPTFLVGLALQLPFALVAFALAVLLLRAAETVVAAGGRRPRRTRGAAPALRLPLSRHAVPRVGLALGHAQRGPPRRSCRM
jgi:hypothetical protein